jgi:hypothetical protein
MFLFWLFRSVSLYHFNDTVCIICKLYKITLDVLYFVQLASGQGP